MPQLLREDFADKWIPLLADNVFMNIDGPLLERLIVDIKDSFAASTLTANVPDWIEGTYYPQGYVILHRFVPGPDIFLKANQEGYLDEPAAAVGDVNWSPALSPAPDNALYQIGTVEAMRRAYVNWHAGRLYVLVGRTDPDTGESLPDVYVRALSATQLEPEGWLFDKQAIGAGPVRVRYALDTDETQPVVLDAYTKREVNYLLDDQIGYLPNLVTATKSNVVAALNELARQKVSLAVLVPKVGEATHFATCALAQQAAQPGDNIFLNGYHGDVSVTKSVNIYAGSCATLTVGYNTPPLTVQVADTMCAGRIVTCVPTTAGAKHQVTYTSIGTGPLTFFEQFGFEGGASAWAEVTISQTDGHNRSLYSPSGNGEPGGGMLRFQERESRYSRYTLLDTNFRSENNTCISGYPTAATKVIFAGRTTVEPATGRAVQETRLLNAPAVQLDADIIIEQRTGGSTGGGGGSGPGAGLSRTLHKTYAGRRYTGPLVIFSPPGPLRFVPLDANMYGYAFQVNYQDVARPGYWVAGAYLAEIADVEAALAAVPAASYPLGVQLRTAIVPQDTTIETLFYIDGLGAGNIEGSTTQFLVSYTGPPYGTLNTNSQFREAFPSGWTTKAVTPTTVAIGGGLLIMANSTSNNLEDLTMQPVTLMKDVTYKMLIGVASIGGGTTLNIGWREGGNSFVQVDYVSTLGENAIYFTPTFSSPQWYCHIWGAKDIQVTHMHILPA